MPSRARLEWDGEAVEARVAEAARAAIDDTLREAEADASTSHWWRNRTGLLEQQIVVEAATVDAVTGNVAGRFGTTQRHGFYGLFLEYKLPFLRPAGDRTFPTLAGKIRRRLNGNG